MTERIETAIIGGGQAGLAMSYHLSQLGREHVILEAKWPGHRWRTERWDAFAYQHPNWTLQLPGYGYQGDDPDGFVARDEVARFVEGYATFIRAPVRCGVPVTGLRQKPGAERLLVESNDMTIEAANVVVATGPYQRPVIPRPAAAMHPQLFQIHSSGYRNPGQLPPGAVLVVGSGASGSQITEDLREAGRRVYLSVGNHRRTLRRYRGRDTTWWMMTMGWLDTVPGEEGKAPGVITGVRGGYDIDVRRFPANGVQLLGHLRGAEGGKLIFALDVEQTLSLADEYCRHFLRSVTNTFRKRASTHPSRTHRRRAPPFRPRLPRSTFGPPASRR